MLSEELLMEELENLPSPYSSGEGLSLCLDLLSSVSEVFDAAIASMEEQEMEYEQYHNPSVVLKVRSEVIFPVIGLFDTDMFILNYSKFY